MSGINEIFLDQFNAPLIKGEWENARSRALKRELIKEGYSHQISFYGILTHKETGASQYSRIEVLSDEALSGDEIALMHEFYKALKPLDIYTIWIYRKASGSVLLKGRYN
jgi:hypothetical protein